MPRRWLKRVLPDVDKYRDTALARMLGPRFFHPALWHLSRRSVAGGFAIGLLCGLIPGPLQMVGAGAMAVWLKRNLPVALVTTLYTNPLTIIPIYIVAYHLGALVIGPAATAVAPPVFSGVSPVQFAEALGAWSTSLGKPLLLGIPLLGLLLALAGYMLVFACWSGYLVRVRARRRMRARPR